MASNDGTVDVFWTSHIDSKRVGTVETLAIGESQAAVSTGLARVATTEDKRSAGAKKAAVTRKENAVDDSPKK